MRSKSISITRPKPRQVSQTTESGVNNYDACYLPDDRIVFTSTAPFTGVPCVVDLAAMRNGIQALGGDPSRINPVVPADLVIDHSVQIDHYGAANALDLNTKIEFQRNLERYSFLKWGQQAFDNFKVVPPSTGIVHQVNLEYLAQTVWTDTDQNGATVAYPDTLVGTDSHTTMINGLGGLGWGVGGIEAEAVMLGQPLYMLTPEVIGFEMTGRLPPEATATDLVLTVTQILRAEGVVGKFVEYFGPGVGCMTVADRALFALATSRSGADSRLFFVELEQGTLAGTADRSFAGLQAVDTAVTGTQIAVSHMAPCR